MSFGLLSRVASYFRLKKNQRTAKITMAIANPAPIQGVREGVLITSFFLISLSDSIDFSPLLVVSFSMSWE